MPTKTHSYYYVATPYLKYPQGTAAAARMAAEQAGFLLHAGIPVFCPIAHGEFIKEVLGMSEFPWLECDRPLVEKARGLIVCCAESWQESYGISKEIQWARELHKSIFYMNPDDPSNVIMHICTYFPQSQGEMAIRRRAALTATFAYKHSQISLNEWRQTILSGKCSDTLANTVNELLDQDPPLV